jgi:malate synthase
MEDAATAEISRTQIWQWLRHDARLEDGRPVRALYPAVRDAELAGIRRHVGEDGWRAGRFEPAAAIFDRLATSDSLEDFLTIPAYEELIRTE